MGTITTIWSCSPCLFHTPHRFSFCRSINICKEVLARLLKNPYRTRSYLQLLSLANYTFWLWSSSINCGWWFLVCSVRCINYFHLNQKDLIRPGWICNKPVNERKSIKPFYKVCINMKWAHRKKTSRKIIYEMFKSWTIHFEKN